MRGPFADHLARADQKPTLLGSHEKDSRAMKTDQQVERKRRRDRSTSDSRDVGGNENDDFRKRQKKGSDPVENAADKGELSQLQEKRSKLIQAANDHYDGIEYRQRKFACHFAKHSPVSNKMCISRGWDTIQDLMCVASSSKNRDIAKIQAGNISEDAIFNLPTASSASESSKMRQNYHIMPDPAMHMLPMRHAQKVLKKKRWKCSRLVMRWTGGSSTC